MKLLQYIAPPFFDSVLSSGDHESALEICRIWALADPEGAGPHFSMARVYTEMGDIEGAKRCFNLIIDKFDGTRSADFARRRLEALGE